ncbi:unnamed protein product [Darwinula stevensoni]|uniref:Superoxide dismutase [Cu-Zn] n=1 Tax=Darwinula stevensoni TaxID=69355 RepID=A0A7R9FNA0_9CRUS|nr:unnamed protein product [Darwinula stevensoni]CAG0896257.1 unnamed protein product [Darwinula stevensoni]
MFSEMSREAGSTERDNTLRSFQNVGNRRAIVVLNNPPVNGVLEFIQQGSGSRLVLNGNVSGLTPGKHGFHIHEYGDVSQGCGSTKGHYNPFQVKHGAPDAEERHVGDLGNIIADQNGVAQVRIVDSVLSLYGDTSVIGRAIVVHAGEDDLGRGGDEGSMNTGNAGGRVACGIIGIAPPQ